MNELEIPGIKIKKNELLAPYTAYKIGGPADYFADVRSSEELVKAIEAAGKAEIPYILLGGGCNTVFSDKGFRGLVIHNMANKIEVHGSQVVVESGAMLGTVINKAREHELGGIIKLIGLPGTIGGAIYGNAGAQGIEIGDFVISVKIYRKGQGIVEEPKEYFQFSYRHSFLKKSHEIVLEVKLDLPTLDPEDISAEVMKFRAEKQPKGKVAGSFFKNPTATESAGFLIDKVGLKGLKIGDVEISRQHGNWLMNLGNATQKDVLEVAKKAKETVKDKFGFDLEPENILLDEHGNKIDI
ncbi:UDP-N-acetylmuramate dehydrogenase [Patescibacteria group bacterium]